MDLRIVYLIKFLVEKDGPEDYLPREHLGEVGWT